jgi:predicted nuclease of restriction endonuclease-like (RecB) superfamily
MKQEINYTQFIKELKQNIINSRYITARLVNKEQLFLYFKTGEMIHQKINNEKWGTKVLEQIAQDLQKQLPGLKGFSQRNLFNMRQFYIEYQSIIIVQSLTAQL